MIQNMFILFRCATRFNTEAVQVKEFDQESEKDGNFQPSCFIVHSKTIMDELKTSICTHITK